MKTWGRMRGVALLFSFVGATACSAGGDEDGPRGGGSSTGGERNATCAAGESRGEVQEPVFVANLTGQTSWYAAPVIADLDGDGSNELIAAYYSVYVFDSEQQLLADSDDGDEGRVYAPHVVVDLEGDGSKEIVVGRGHRVVAYSWSGSSSGLDRRWVADTTTAGNAPEVRGLAAADLDGDGNRRGRVTTTSRERATTQTGTFRGTVGLAVTASTLRLGISMTTPSSRSSRPTTTITSKPSTMTESPSTPRRGLTTAARNLPGSA